MIRSLKITVVDQRVSHRDVEITLWPPGERMEALMHVIPRHAPEQPFSAAVLPVSRHHQGSRTAPRA